MPLAQLTDEERAIVLECLECVASGKIIPDWEFSIVMGIQRGELLDVVDRWPDVDDSDDTVSLAINNSLNNLLGYPHAYHSRWDDVLSVPKSEVARVFRKWRGKPASRYFDGLR